MTAVRAIVQATCLLLDFDGPVCSLFSDPTDRAAVAELGAELPEPLPGELRDANDPFAVLRYAATVYGDSVMAGLERRFTEFELAAVQGAEPTPSADEVIRSAATNSRMVAVVGNNSPAAIDAYLTQHGLRSFVSGIFGRTAVNLMKLKPAPFLLEEAAGRLAGHPGDCVFVGDSITDLEAAHASRVPVVAFANKPGKADHLARHRPAAVIHDMAELLLAHRRSGILLE
ncbi:HAD family hydrolase [Nocardia jiangxiensis]|uniref:HAD family hydrolase n=1 Tax=Nocardia jiangxiensis TaxID=282685 RepID=UPI0002E67B45|nr:HAD family hydrolase [Nocardia jiangxiensis]